MTDIQWKNPPASKTGPKSSERINKVVRVLQGNPGQWALIAENVTVGSGVTYQRRGCEVTRRRTGEKGSSGVALFDIYARWPEDADQ